MSQVLQRVLALTTPRAQARLGLAAFFGLADERHQASRHGGSRTRQVARPPTRPNARGSQSFHVPRAMAVDAVDAGPGARSRGLTVGTTEAGSVHATSERSLTSQRLAGRTRSENGHRAMRGSITGR